MHEYANPARFMSVARIALPLLVVATLLLLGAGLYMALGVSPADYQQGEFVRIMYVHVPAAWMALMIYAVMAVASAAMFIWKHPLAALVAQQSAPIGAGFTLICLITGMLWGKPMWGTWWVWDARLTSVLILFFLYIGYMALVAAHGERGQENKPAALLALVGIINLPIIHFSVEWWYTLHQPASVFRMEGAAIHSSMLRPLMVMWLGFIALYSGLLVARMQAALMERKVLRRQARARSLHTT